LLRFIISLIAISAIDSLLSIFFALITLPLMPTFRHDALAAIRFRLTAFCQIALLIFML